MATTTITPLADTSELVELFKPLSLYLKPMARLNISVALPQLKDPGQSISNWDLMERIKKMVHPIQFAAIKVAKSTIEFVRFEADVDNRQLLTKVIKALDGSAVKVIGFYETLKVRAAEAKSDFPSRHDWDSFFRDAKNMNELRPGERPDTIYLAHLPCKWFQSNAVADDDEDDESSDPNLPSERVLRKVFESFGEIRCVDIPVCDPYRKEMSKTGLRTVGFSFGGELTFEGYVQYVEYISFVKAMDALRNMKLVKFDDFGKAHQAQIKVDFDRTKHLSDKNIRRMRLERERLIEIERSRKEEEERIRMQEEKKRSSIELEKSGRRRQREEKRRIKRLEQKRAEEEQSLERRIKEEERKLLLAQRKLESRRLLNQLFSRVAQNKRNFVDDGSTSSDEEVSDQEAEPSKKQSQERRKLERREKRMRQTLLDDREKRLRNKIRLKYEAKTVEKRRQQRAGVGRERRERHHSSTKPSRTRRLPSPSSSMESDDLSDSSSASSSSGPPSSQSSARTWSSGDENYARPVSLHRPQPTQYYPPRPQQNHRPTMAYEYDGHWPQRPRPPKNSSIRSHIEQRHRSHAVSSRSQSQHNKIVARRPAAKNAVKSFNRSKEASDEGEILDSDD